MALEVVAVRRDGFDGPIEMVMEGLPEGVTAQSLKIAAGQTRGMVLVTARQDAPRSFASAIFTGRATIDGALVTRPCLLASYAWPIPDSWGEIPSPRLLADVPVSVSGVDLAPITIAPASREVREVSVGEKVAIPLVQTLRSEFQGASTELKPIGAGFESAPKLTVTLTADKAEAVFDLGALKVPPGDYLVAFQGSAVSKYRHHPEAVAAAEEAKRLAEQLVMALDVEAKQLAEVTTTATPEAQAQTEKSKAEMTEKQKVAATALAAAVEKLKQATAIAQPQDIVDIVVTEPIALRIKPAESK